MKRRVQVVAMIAFLSAILAVYALTCFRPPAGHCDFTLRMNEVACLRLGVNPYDVWHEDVVFPPYRSNLPKRPVPADCTEQVNAYAPWAYACLLPLSYVPESVRWAVYCLTMGLSLVLTFVLSDRLLARKNLDAQSRFLAVSMTLCVVAYLIWSNISVGNLITLVLLGTLALAECLSRGWMVGAGLCWALAMLKPQVAILFIVPLLMRGCWLTCFVAAVACLALSIVPMMMCRASLLDLLLQGPAANAELFEGCGTWPKVLCGTMGQNADIICGLCLGLVICIWMTWQLRKEKSWLRLLMPAAVCSSCWTYTQVYSHAIEYVFVLVLAADLFKSSPLRMRQLFFVLSSFLVVRVFLAWHGLFAWLGRPFPLGEYAYRAIDSFNSTGVIVLAALYCHYRREQKL